MNSAGKGDTRRPRDDSRCTADEFAERWRKVFGKKPKDNHRRLHTA